MSSAIDRLRSCPTWTWRLDIRGLGVRYYSHAAPPTRAITGLPATNYLDRRAIIAVSGQSESIEVLGGIQKGGEMTVTLASRGELADAYDPVSVLCRSGPDGATASTRLAESIPHDTSLIASVEVTDDLSSWPVTDTRYCFWVGQEAFIAEGIASGPDRFTNVHRAAMGSPPQEHLYDPARGQQPWVTSEPVNWRSVRCALLVAADLGRPMLESDYVEVLRGFLNSAPPSHGSAGLTLTVSLVPASVVLDQTISPTGHVTGLLANWHYFTPGRACQIAHTQVGLRGQLAWGHVTTAAPPTAVTVNVPNGSAQALTDLTRPDNHPRRLPLIFGSVIGQPEQERLTTAFNAGPPESVDIDPSLSDDVPLNALVQNKHVWDVKVYDAAPLLPRTVEWPDRILTELNAAWSPGQVGGADGAWADVEVGVDADGQVVVRSRLNATHILGELRLEFRADWSVRPPAGEVDQAQERDEYFPGQGYTGRDRHALLHYGLQFCAPDDDRWFDARSQERIGATTNPLDRSGGRWARWLSVAATRQRNTPRSVGAIRGYPAAFYQTGERYILTRGAIFGTSVTGEKWVEITWFEAGTQLTQIVRIASESTHQDADGNDIGFRLELAEGWEMLCRSFGDWPGEQATRIRAIAAWEASDAASLVLQVLLSGRGAGVNSAGYDRLPFGANFDTNDVNGGSVLLRMRPPFDDRWSLEVAPKDKLKDLIETPLIAAGVALVMRPNNLGWQQITAVPVGIETVSELEENVSIPSGRVQATGRPDLLPDDLLVARYQVTANYPRGTEAGEPLVNISETDAMAAAAQGGEVGEALEVALKGIYFDTVGDAIGRLQPLFGSLRARLGRSRRRYQLTLDKGWALALWLGSVIKLTAPDAIGVDGRRGVVDLVCRVVRRAPDWWGSTCTFDLLAYGARTRGWAPSMQVASVGSSTVLTVEDNAFSDPTDLRGDAQLDVDWFAVGDIVRCVPRGNFAGSVIRTISAISGTTVTFAAGPGGGSAAHGLVAGDTIRPAPYSVVLDSQRQGYAFFCNALGKVGSPGEPGPQWS